jgi:hypothetical protein
VGLTFKVVSESVKVQYGKEESKEDTWGEGVLQNEVVLGMIRLYLVTCLISKEV